MFVLTDEGESLKDASLRLLEVIHSEALRARARAVSVGALTFVDGSPTTYVTFAR